MTEQQKVKLADLKEKLTAAHTALHEHLADEQENFNNLPGGGCDYTPDEKESLDVINLLKTIDDRLENSLADVSPSGC